MSTDDKNKKTHEGESAEERSPETKNDASKPAEKEMAKEGNGFKTQEVRRFAKAVGSELTSRMNKWSSWFFFLALLFLLIIVVFHVRKILLPFILGIVIAYILSPVVDWLSSKTIRSHHPPRWVAVIVIYLVLGFSTFLFSIIVLPRFSTEFAKLADEAPVLIRKASQVWIPDVKEKVNHWLAELNAPIEELQAKKQELEEKKSKEAPAVGEAQNEPEKALRQAEESEADLQSFPEHERPMKKPLKTNEAEALRKEIRRIAPTLIASLEDYTLEVETISEKKSRVRFVPKERFEEQDGEGLAFDQTVKSYLADFADGSEVLLGNAISVIQAVIAKIVSSIFTLVLTLMIAAFILVDKPKIMHFFRSLIPPEYRKDYDRLLHGIDRGLGGVIRGQLMICVVNGTLTGIGLFVLGVKYAVILALIATVFSLIPIFGTILSSIPSIAIAMTQSFTLALLVLLWIIIIHLIEANFLNPKIIGTSAHIHPVLVVFALVAGEYAYGLFGALLAVAVFSIFQTLFLYFRAKAYPE